MDGNQSRLLEALRSHKPSDSTERSHQEVIARQVAATPLWWKRTTLPGHVTASGFVLSPDLNQILLHHHRKLDRWLQMGGHDEGDASPWITADREVREESGLQNPRMALGGCFLDLDVHEIPENRKEPGHLHLDCRFLYVADPASPISLALEESKELKWFPLREGIEKMNEVGARRILGKLMRLQNRDYSDYPGLLEWRPASEPELPESRVSERE